MRILETRDERRGTRRFPIAVLVSSLIPLLSSLPLLGIDTPPRLFFSDARLSFEIPVPWEVTSSFPFGPLLTRKTQEGTDAFIVCQISEPINTSRLSADASVDILQNFATHDLSTRATGARTLATAARTLAGQNAYEVTWLNEGPEGVTQYQSDYFFLDNRFYVLSLKANRDSFPWIVQDYQNWLNTLRFLSRQNGGKLDPPAHGGLWVHQTGGAKIEIPEDWLIGVADDRELGATLARDKMNIAFTAVVDALSPATHEMTAEEKKEARKTLEDKGRKIVSESEEPFHGLPAFQLVYEDTVDGRFVRGQDLWVWSPKARWLLSIDGDSRLLRQLEPEWQGILSNIHFYQ